jgi:hypothetical protein
MRAVESAARGSLSSGWSMIYTHLARQPIITTGQETSASSAATT